MPLFDTDRQRAALLVALLGIGLALALAPFATGLIGAVVLYVIFAPANALLRRHMGPGLAASLITALALVLILVPGFSFAGLVVSQAQQMASGVAQNPLLRRLGDLEIAGYAVGPRLASLGENLVSWIGSSALGLIGTATRLALNLTIAFFGLYFLLLRPQQTWEMVHPHIPFSHENTERLRQRFRDVTNSTLLGTLLIAIVQGVLVAAAFAVVGLSNAVFWGTVTAIFSILPLVGSGLVWAPGAISLALDGRYPAAVGLVIWGVVVVGMVDNVLRPTLYRRWAHIHPVVTLVGAIGGLKYFGVLGIFVGPLALSYFFELIRMYREEYLEPAKKRPA